MNSVKKQVWVQLDLDTELIGLHLNTAVRAVLDSGPSLYWNPIDISVVGISR